MFKKLWNIRKEDRSAKIAKFALVSSIELSVTHNNALVDNATDFIIKNEIKLTQRKLKLNPYAKYLAEVFSSGDGMHWLKLDNMYAAAKVEKKLESHSIIHNIEFYCLSWEVEKLKQHLTKLYTDDIHLPIVYAQEEHAPPGHFVELGRISSFYGEREQFVDIETYNEVDTLFKRMINDKAWYVDHHKAHKETILFTGPPGTGKSTLVRHMASKYGLDIYTMTPKQLRPTSQIGGGKQLTLILLEDIDAYRMLCNEVEDEDDGTKGFTTRRSESTYNTFINFLDGVLPLDNVIIVMTTNYPERLKESVTRKGRVDAHFYLDHPQIPRVIDLLGWSKDSELAQHVLQHYTRGDITVGMMTQLRKAVDVPTVVDIISTNQKYIKEDIAA